MNLTPDAPEPNWIPIEAIRNLKLRADTAEARVKELEAENEKMAEEAVEYVGYADMYMKANARLKELLAFIEDQGEQLKQARNGREQAQQELAKAREDSLHYVMNRACGELPDMYRIIIELENGSASVKLVHDDLPDRDLYEDETSIGEQIIKSIDIARMEGRTK